MKKNYSVLIADDDKSFLDSLTEKFKEQDNVSVLIAFDGEEALRKTIEKRPDIVLLDLIMPKVDGVEFLKQLRAQKDEEISDTRVLVITQQADFNKMAEVTPYGIKGYFIKSELDFDKVLSKIEEVLK